jgi:hypothetical protein
MHYRDILARTSARYLRVRPDGIEIAPRHEPRPTLIADLFDHSPARTCYQNRRPVCRSLDGVQALGNPALRCRHCELRSQCTPQVRLSLAVDDTPYQLLLAFTSARNFIAYHAQLQKTGHDLADVRTRLVIVDHGTWGEVRFEIAGREGEVEPSQRN